MATVKRKGFALIITYLVIVLLLILVGAYVTFTFTETRAARKSQMVSTALYLAEAGVDRTIVDLEGFGGVDLTQQQVGYEVFPRTYFSLGNMGGFERRATVAQIVSSGFFLPDPQTGNLTLITSPAIIVRIEAWGHASSATMPALTTNAPDYQMKYIEALVNVMPSPLFPMALFTQEEIDLNNSLIDSYNRMRGAYGGANVGNSGDIGSNNARREKGVIELRGNSTVKGDATVGPSVPYTKAIDIDKNAQITGAQSNAPKEVTLTPPTTPSGTNAINIAKVNDAQVFPGGVYSASSIKIDGKGSVAFSGPTVIYVSGDVDIGGNGIISTSSHGYTDVPSSLTIKVVGCNEVKISGDANFYGSVYAPRSKVQISGNGDVFGAVVAKEAKVAGAGKRLMGIHYDESLINVPGGSGYRVTTLAWHDLS